jgi:hypothetical protein
MAGTVYALLVGIDAYTPPVNALYGCSNDVAHLETFLNGRLGDRLKLKKLLNEEATRDAIASTFTSHLGQARAGDVALFCYSGHGTEEPAPPQYAALEPSGKLQVLVSVDAGRRVDGKLRRGLADKELALLIDGVAANGPHVAVVLDCCHSGNGTRDPEARPRQWLPRPELADDEHRADVEELTGARDVGDFLPGVFDDWTKLGTASSRDPGTSSDGSANHVALAACQSFEVAKEQPTDGQVRGAFSVAFLGALAALGPDTTYRTLLATVRSRVERAAAEQTPVLYPVEVDGPGDGRVFEGTVQDSAPKFHMTTTATGFEIDAGSVHGLTAPSDGQAYELTCTGPDGKVAGQVRVTAVDIGTSTVEPIGWKPDDIAYDAVVSVVPLPPAVVSFDKVDGGDAAYDLVRSAIANAGGTNIASPHVRVLDAGASTPAGALVLRVAAHPDGYSVERENADGTTTTEQVAGAWFRILRADGTPIVADVAGVDAKAASEVVAQLEHLARWELLRGLGDHPSKLRDAVRLVIYPAEPNETSLPADRAAITPSEGYQLAYRQVNDAFVPPQVFVQLENTSDEDLYVAVLDLTDRFGCATGLFPTERVAPKHTVSVWNGKPVPVELPKGREVRSGASVSDWLKVIVSESDFDSSAFVLGALDDPKSREAPTSRGAPTSTLARLAAVALTRTFGGDDGAPPPAAPEWCATTIPVVTKVP